MYFRVFFFTGEVEDPIRIKHIFVIWICIGMCTNKTGLSPNYNLCSSFIDCSKMVPLLQFFFVRVLVVSYVAFCLECLVLIFSFLGVSERRCVVIMAFSRYP